MLDILQHKVKSILMRFLIIILWLCSLGSGRGGEYSKRNITQSIWKLNA